MLKKPRGRPRKTPVGEVKPKGKRGRPRKNPLPEEQVQEEIVEETPAEVEEVVAAETTEASLPGFENIETNVEENVPEVAELPGFENVNVEEPVEQATDNGIEEVETTQSTSLPGFEDETTEEIDSGDDSNSLPGFVSDDSSSDFSSFDTFEKPEGQDSKEIIDNEIANINSIQESDTLPGFENDEDENENDESLENIELSSSITKNPVNDFETNSNNLQSISNIGDDDESEEEIVSPIQREETALPGFDDAQEESDVVRNNVTTATSFRNSDNDRRSGMKQLDEKVVYSTGTLDSVLTSDKKIVAFIGTSKNGT